MVKVDVLVIGGGPGGYSAAIRSAQLGHKTMLVEKHKLGGVCLNEGCIPTKVLLAACKMIDSFKIASIYGIEIDKYEINTEKLNAYKNTAVEMLVNGVAGLLEANEVEIMEGHAKFLSNHKLLVGKHEVEADYIIIAAGSINKNISFPGISADKIISSSQALSIDVMPKSIGIIGGGVIGLEFCEIYNYLGAKVFLFESMTKLLPYEDDDISQFVKDNMSSKGVNVYTSANVLDIKEINGKREVSFEYENTIKKVKVDQAMVAVGRKPNTENLGLENTSISYGAMGINVDCDLKTSVDGIYAIGDIRYGSNQLAHSAMYEGEKVAEVISGLPGKINLKHVPNCIYCIPEIASIGFKEYELIGKGIKYKVGKLPLVANGMSLISGKADGYIKIISDNIYDEILGIQIIAPIASELINEAALAMKTECTIEEIIDTIHTHPTVGESFREAAMDSFKRSIHYKL